MEDSVENDSIVQPHIENNTITRYIRNGPQKLNTYTQRTTCNLMLYVDQAKTNNND